MAHFKQVVERGLKQFFRREAQYRGDDFATASDLKNIESDPVGFSDLLKGEDAHRLFKDLMEAFHDLNDIEEGDRVLCPQCDLAVLPPGQGGEETCGSCGAVLKTRTAKI